MTAGWEAEIKTGQFQEASETCSPHQQTVCSSDITMRSKSRLYIKDTTNGAGAVSLEVSICIQLLRSGFCFVFCLCSRLSRNGGDLLSCHTDPKASNMPHVSVLLV